MYSCRKTWIGLLLLLATPWVAFACSYPEPPNFAQSLKDAKAVVVVRVESVRLIDPKVGPVRVTPDLEATVRVAESIVGTHTGLKSVQYASGWCGGHNLIVGEYYVLLLRTGSSTVQLVPDDPSVIPLYGEYDEEHGVAGSQSHLLLQFRNYKRLGTFPDAFPIHKYLEGARGKVPTAPR